MPSSDVVSVDSLDAFSRAQSVTNAFGGRALPGPAGGASAFLPDPLAAIGVGVLLLRGMERKGEDEER